MANVSIITVLDHQHLWFSTDQAPESIESASDGVIAEHIASRLASLEGVKRFVIVFQDLSWKVDVALDQQLAYTGPARDVALGLAACVRRPS